METPGVLQVTRTSPPLVPGTTNGHLSQSHDSRPRHCQSCNEICMKQGCLAAAGPVLINDSIHRCPTRNTFIIHYLFMQTILCILIPPPAVLHWNESKLKLCLKFKVVPLPWAACPLTVMHSRQLGSETFLLSHCSPCKHRSKCLSSPNRKHVCGIEYCQLNTSFWLCKGKKSVLHGESELSDLNRS